MPNSAELVLWRVRSLKESERNTAQQTGVFAQGSEDQLASLAKVLKNPSQQQLLHKRRVEGFLRRDSCISEVDER